MEMDKAYTPLTKEEIAELWGEELPEIEPIYYTLAEDYKGGRKELAPYMMKKLFSLEEAALAAALPGTPADVSEKLGIPKTAAAEKLYQMVIRGKIAAVGDEDYVRFRNLGALKDWVFSNEKYDLEKGRNFAIMMEAWDNMADFFTSATPPGFRQLMRIVPKWEAIKDIPGVMPCENMPEMLRSALKDGSLSFNRCPCRAVYNIAVFGEHVEGNCRGGLKEGHTPKEGICMAANERGRYFKKYLGGYTPTEEELEERIQIIENACTYYSIENVREFKGLCNCCDDCHCSVRKPYDLGNEEHYAKSRFIAYMDDEALCTGCGACEDACHFKKSVKVENGKAAVNAGTCHGCGNCVVQCPSGALRMKLIRPASHIPRLTDVFQNLPLDENGNPIPPKLRF